MGRRAFPLAMMAVALVAVVAALAGVGVRSTFGGRAAVDEPQYLLSALSLAEDGDLDIADELAARRWRAFHDAELPMQTRVLPGGHQISPHDPLLSLLLAGPVGLGGLVAAKATLALLSGALAALLVWVAVRRFHVPLPLAAVGVGLAAASPPLVVYGQQIYPELPAALAVAVAVAALTGALAPGGLAALAAAVVALPWLSVKYAVVAAALAGLGLARLRARPRAAGVLVVGWALAAVAFVVVHRHVWGGLTPYASGDHFVATGEFSVVGVAPDYAARSVRLVALLVDRTYGLVPWQPAWLLAVPALAALLRRRPPGWSVLALPLLAGWLVATFLALTMQGYWWPGRQVVVVLPLAVLAVLVWLARVPRPLLAGAAVLAGAGVASYAALVADGSAGLLTWVSGFERVHAPAYAALRPLLPDYTGGWSPALWVRHGAWLAALALAGWRATDPAPLRWAPLRWAPLRGALLAMRDREGRSETQG
ncbi:MAG TPA: hypothetical protein VKP64_02390 [Mycobacteriales bacterium]|nr:hypothetical protein [Mycobacteriales bacterium]